MSRERDKEQRSQLPLLRDPRIVQAFLATADPEAGTDQLASPRDLADWLVSRQLLEPDAEVTAAAVQRAMAFREGVRAWRAADGKPGKELIASLGWTVATVQFRFRITRRLQFLMEPSVPGVDGALGRLLAIMIMDQGVEHWPGLGENARSARSLGGLPNLSRRWPACRWYGLRCCEWLESPVVARRRKRRPSARR